MAVSGHRFVVSACDAHITPPFVNPAADAHHSALFGADGPRCLDPSSQPRFIPGLAHRGGASTAARRHIDLWRLDESRPLAPCTHGLLAPRRRPRRYRLGQTDHHPVRTRHPHVQRLVSVSSLRAACGPTQDSRTCNACAVVAGTSADTSRHHSIALKPRQKTQARRFIMNHRLASSPINQQHAATKHAARRFLKHAARRLWHVDSLGSSTQHVARIRKQDDARW